MRLRAVTHFGRHVMLPAVLFIGVVLTGFVGGCGTTDSGSVDFLHANVDGRVLHATSWMIGSPVGEITIQANFLTDLSVSFDLDADTVGIYRVGIGTSHASLFDRDDIYDAHGVTAGQIEITSITDDRIEGTFGFVLRDREGVRGTRNVTSGSFSLPFFVE